MATDTNTAVSEACAVKGKTDFDTAPRQSVHVGDENNSVIGSKTVNRSDTIMADLFSVPPQKNIPNSGIYAMPRDAYDGGKILGMDPRYFIKDIDTGKIYSLESAGMDKEGNKEEMGFGSSSVLQSVGPMQKGVQNKSAGIQLSNVLSGEKLSLEEFETTMGYTMVPEENDQMQTASQHTSWWKDAFSKLGLLKIPDDQVRGYGSPNDSISPYSSPKDDSLGLRIKVTSNRKNFKEFSDLRLVQSIYAHEGVIWAAKFSKSGKYLATAGQDGVVAVWIVDQNRRSDGGHVPDDGGEEEGPSLSREKSGEGEEGYSEMPGVIHGVPVLKTTPYRLYKGHKKDVLDIAWSSSNFLFSASMDKSVRLWHVSVGDCLKVFRHNDFVTSIDVHPKNEALFISGSIDGKVRLWNVPETRVVSWQDIHDMVTAVAFSKDGSRAVVGSMRGKCWFYSLTNSNALEYEAQLDVKNKRGQHARGKKITGLTFAPKMFPNALLITSNDSRIRLFDGYTLRFKYKGHSNKSTQIKASFSPKGNFIICGSGEFFVFFLLDTMALVKCEVCFLLMQMMEQSIFGTLPKRQRLKMGRLI
jgi:WD40 repeat protein